MIVFGNITGALSFNWNNSLVEGLKRCLEPGHFEIQQLRCQVFFLELLVFNYMLKS